MGFQVRDHEGRLTVELDGREIIRHSRTEPWIYAGHGEGQYDMYRGNFSISDRLGEKLALIDYIVESSGSEGARVTFSRSGLNSLTVLFGQENGRAVIRFTGNTDRMNRLWLRLAAEEREHVYGCGEQFSHFDLRGKNFPLWTSEQGVGRNKDTYVTFLADKEDRAGGDYYWTFFPQPTFVSSRKYYCHVDDSAYMDFDFRNANYHELHIWNIPEKLVLETADTYVGLLRKLTAYFGRQPELPDWVYEGVWIGVQGGTEVVLSKLDHALSKGLKVSGIWAQDWQGVRYTSFGKRLMWNWIWNRELYPGLDEEIVKLREKGIKFLGYINPYVAVEGHLFKEASEGGFLAKDTQGEDYLVDFGEFYAGIVDFTNPKACEWYKKVIKENMIQFGLSGWMADFGEYLPTDVVLHNGAPAEWMHNAWPAIWAGLNREAIEEAGKLDEVTFFMRAGYTGSQKYCTMMWAGDQNVDWSLDDGLASVIPAALSLAMTGCGLHHSDIGGYTTLFGMKRTKELFMRWAEHSAFTPLMRTHEGNRPDDNWQFDSDDETLLHFARMSRVYVALRSYLKAAVKENAESGVPVMRPLFLHYEADERVYSIQYQYLLGRDLLVAPVIEEEKSAWAVYLPEDHWIHLWTGKSYWGGDVEVEAPVGQPPVFYRADSSYAALFEALRSLE
ncbi:alpha-glucosidase [Paenibacillus sp. J2TS4]|uniref:alpha-glucosidase n=1 Tax=Paenibacillus sp. J2TS4 TaxID=2807194 RepID=UPI001B07E9B2|nr:alpha-glucosidase [Paenibacillus sp. J2TS4]GIP31551.1 alpha-glucosidase [Paenibacillus sp. J2TS4]